MEFFCHIVGTSVALLLPRLMKLRIP